MKNYFKKSTKKFGKFIFFLYICKMLYKLETNSINKIVKFIEEKKEVKDEFFTVEVTCDLGKVDIPNLQTKLNKLNSYII